MIYLASPYAHPSADVRQQRYEEVTDVAARLVADGWNVYSPIMHTHPLVVVAEGHSNPFLASLAKRPHEFWMHYDHRMMRHSDRLLVLTLAGWTASRGVSEEISFFQQRCRPMATVAPQVVMLHGTIRLDWKMEITIPEVDHGVSGSST